MAEAPQASATSAPIPLTSFMRHLAHELGNPVASIRMSAEMLLGDYPSEMHGELFQIIMSESQRLESLIENAVYFVSVGTPSPVELEISQIVESALRQAELTDPPEIRMDLKQTVLYGDITQISRLFREVLCNAAESGATSVLISSAAEGSDLVVSVGDNGKGIPPEKLANIFSPFFTTREGKLGLGLSIAKRIVELHDGTLEVAPADPAGTAATMRFPQSSR
jgi:signal transduction histidine kinase